MWFACQVKNAYTSSLSSKLIAYPEICCFCLFKWITLDLLPRLHRFVGTRLGLVDTLYEFKTYGVGYAKLNKNISYFKV